MDMSLQDCRRITKILSFRCFSGSSNLFKKVNKDPCTDLRISFKTLESFSSRQRYFKKKKRQKCGVNSVIKTEFN